jgi:hypothetical protein
MDGVHVRIRRLQLKKNIISEDYYKGTTIRSRTAAATAADEAPRFYLLFLCPL